jgi:soluble lytic murein transglycosylase
LLRNFAAGLKDGGELVLAARLAQAINAHNVAILIADNADRRGMPLDLFSFPKDGLPADKLAEIDHAAVYAIAKQESHFQVDAVSGVGARGLMQLMPATAKETAQKLGVDYSQTRLTSDPAYNALLGSTYLAAQLKRFEGSLVLAAAAYNAGGGNANKWIATYGDPRTSNVDPVVWVELIPFQETRKYVQRVLGNYVVYRTRLGDSGLTITDVLRRIPN